MAAEVSPVETAKADEARAVLAGNSEEGSLR